MLVAWCDLSDLMLFWLTTPKAHARAPQPQCRRLCRTRRAVRAAAADKPKLAECISQLKKIEHHKVYTWFCVTVVFLFFGITWDNIIFQISLTTMGFATRSRVSRYHYLGVLVL